MNRTQRTLATAALAVALLAGPARASSFIEDDYDAARAEARARKLPILVEVWAPW